MSTTVAVITLLALSIRMYSRFEQASATWDSGVASTQVVDFAGLRTPATAVDLRWGYLNGLQDDAAVLSFRLPPGEVDGFAAGLGIERWTGTSSVQNVALEGLRRVGAPDPAASSSLREGEFELRPPAHEAVSTTVWLAPAADGSTQVWVYAMNTP
ncbi:hypothetical protein OH807_15365 [Kitasatospora sp. NBC_01560]|uniref:hypothetical protein n=1 Tax=Kitasatospora sp. NBC_01560 TaxID=2975965 RepID=UPI00386403E6